MKYRQLGKDGPLVSEIGFGTWGIGGETPGATSYGRTDDRISVRALEAAFECGITFFDTANVYGDGHSETLIGKTFADRRDSIVVATKAGYTAYDEPPDFSPSAVHDSVEGSLRRLRSDYLDLLQLHNPDPRAPGLDETFEALHRLREKGKIRAFGVSLSAPEDGEEFLERFDISAIQVNLNLLDQRADTIGLLERALGAGLSIIARTPLCFGFLAGEVDPKRVFDVRDHRSRWPRVQIRRWVEGNRMFQEDVAAKSGQPLPQVALRYCLSHHAVASVIPGIMTAEEARDNAAASDAEPLTPEELDLIRGLYARHEFFVEQAERPSPEIDRG
jgi:aryl-alcohol dehydrogenase-like predicted oxidoreductase